MHAASSDLAPDTFEVKRTDVAAQDYAILYFTLSYGLDVCWLFVGVGVVGVGWMAGWLAGCLVGVAGRLLVGWARVFG